MKRPKFVVYQDAAGGWRWSLRSANGRIVADSGEAYTRKADAHRAVRRVWSAIDHAFARYEEENSSEWVPF